MQQRTPSALSHVYCDPDYYQTAVRGPNGVFSLLARGTFRAELTRIEFGRLLLRHGRESLPRLASSVTPAPKFGMLIWPRHGLLPVARGVQMIPGEMMCIGLGSHSHYRTLGPNEFIALIVDVEDLNDAAVELIGRELVLVPGKAIRPPERLFTRLLSAVETVLCSVRENPSLLELPAASRSLEQSLLTPMILCLEQSEGREETISRGRHAVIAKRFEELVNANFDSPVPIPELSRMLGVPGRSLHTVCREQFGISPQRFLMLRRLHMARSALLGADPGSATVADIATGHAFWELGRFAVAYKALFGEAPSTTLRRRQF